MPKGAEYEREYKKLSELFSEVDESKRKLVEGLIDDAAFLRSENHTLKKSMEITGMVKIHPDKPDVQKTVESAKQYLKNVTSYAVVIKTLNGVLDKNGIEEDDELSDFE